MPCPDQPTLACDLPSIAFYTLGCKVNQAEAEQLAADLQVAGALLVDCTQADLIIVSTCTVTKDAEAKTRKAIRRLLSENSTAACLVIGCAVAIDADYYQQMDERLIVEADWQKAFDKACSHLGLHQKTGAVNMLPAQKTAARQRQNLKVQDGCDEQCSYCIVSRARGPARSEDLAGLVKAAQAAETSGLRELVLTGVNLGRYTWSGKNLVGLLEALLAATDKCRYRLSSLEPLDASPQLVDLIAASNGRICAHLHLPLQSGSDRILSAMNRPYTIEQYNARVAYAKSRLPQLALSSDIIVGFPGESQADFQKTLEFVTQTGFMRLHVFRFSPRKNTLAAEMTDQVAPQIKAERSAELRSLAERLTIQDIRQRIGQVETVLVERRGRGRAESYHQVILDPACPVASLVTVRFSGHQGQLLECIQPV